MSRVNKTSCFFKKAYSGLENFVVLPATIGFGAAVVATEDYQKVLFGVFVAPLIIVASVATFAIALALASVIGVVHLLSSTIAATLDACEASAIRPS